MLKKTTVKAIVPAAKTAAEKSTGMKKNMKKQYNRVFEEIDTILKNSELSETQRFAQIEAILLLLKDII